MSNSVSRDARADIVVAYGLNQGTLATAKEKSEIDAALAQHAPTTILSAVGPGGSDIVGIHVKAEGRQPARNFFAEDGFSFGDAPPLQWQEAPKRDRSDSRANALAAFELHQGTPATSLETQEINDAIAKGAQPETLLPGLDLGMTDLKGLTLKDEQGQDRTFIAKQTFSFGDAPPLQWIEVPSDAG